MSVPSGAGSGSLPIDAPGAGVATGAPPLVVELQRGAIDWTEIARRLAADQTSNAVAIVGD